MKNAIERRIDQLGELWNEFAEDPQARLLRWLIRGDEVQMIDAFLQVQHEGVGEIPDLFIQFADPFDDSAQYGFTLRESLIEKFDQTHPEISDDDDIPSDWVCPPILKDDTGISAFTRAAVSFRSYYEGIMVNLAVVLTPQVIADPETWNQWLSDLLQSDLPANVRIMIVEVDGETLLDDLCEAEPERIVSTKPELDMPSAMTDLVNAVPGSGPGFTFRRLFVAMTNASSAGNLPAVEKAAEQAIKIATVQNWPSLQVVVGMTLGATYLVAGNKAKALDSYRTANKAVVDSDDPTAPKLIVQTRFAEAAVFVGDEDYEEAAEIYAQVAPLAEEQEDHFSALEGWRMASYCYSRIDDQREQAWECGQRALDAGAKLDDETRANCTLPYAGQILLQLTQQRPYREEEEEVRERMVELMGEDWEAELPQEAVAS